MDVEWRIGSIFHYSAGGPGFDSHPGLHFSEILISLLSDNGLQSLLL